MPGLVGDQTCGQIVGPAQVMPGMPIPTLEVNEVNGHTYLLSERGKQIGLPEG
jgi:hypothetical protein